MARTLPVLALAALVLLLAPIHQAQAAQFVGEPNLLGCPAPSACWPATAARGDEGGRHRTNPLAPAPAAGFDGKKFSYEKAGPVLLLGDAQVLGVAEVGVAPAALRRAAHCGTQAAGPRQRRRLGCPTLLPTHPACPLRPGRHPHRQPHRREGRQGQGAAQDPGDRAHLPKRRRQRHRGFRWQGSDW